MIGSARGSQISVSRDFSLGLDLTIDFYKSANIFLDEVDRKPGAGRQ